MGKKIGNTTSLILGGIGFIILMWVFISWLDVVFHNTIPNYEYSALNFFSWMINTAKHI